MQDYIQNYENWMNCQGLDEKTKTELAGIAGDNKKIKEWFLALIKFGTAGFREIIRPGINGMNIYVVTKQAIKICYLISAANEKCAKKQIGKLKSAIKKILNVNFQSIW